MLTIHNNSGALSRANFRSISLIAPLVSGIAGLSVSSGKHQGGHIKCLM